MIYKLQNGGIIKLQKGKVIPKLLQKIRTSRFDKAAERAFKSSVPDIVQKNIEAGKIGWAPKQTSKLWHNSNNNLSMLEVTFPAWDIVERGAPLGHSWFSSSETTSGFLGKRPYRLIAKDVTINKPLVQIGEAVGNGKNVTRNQILDFAQKSSADGMHFSGIADNQLQNQNIYALFKDVPITGRIAIKSRPISAAEKAGIPKGERPYLVDWTNWSKSTPISEKHLIEYSIIDNDLWRSKFKPFAGTDIRSHIQLRSKDAKKLDPRILFTGVEEVVDPNYNGILWTTRDGLSARAYAPSDDQVMQIVIPKNAKINTYDAKSNGWFEIDGRKMWDKGYRTNDFVNQSFDNGYDIAEIKHVIDIGPNYVPYSSKYNYFDNKLDFLERARIQTDVIIKPEFPRKSIIGNNGDFDLNKQSLFEKKGGRVKKQSEIPESAKAKSYFAGLKDYILHKTKSFIPSQYKPTKGNNIQVQYYTRPGLKEEVALNLFGGTDKNAKNFLGDSNYFYKDFDEAYQDLSKEYIANSSRTASNGTLGEYGVSAGTDDNGRYISFIDNFDHVFIPGKGIPIYDRIYENEINSVYNKNRSAFDEGDWITKSPVLQKLKKKQTK